MEKKPQYKVIVSDRARQMLAGHIQFLVQKSPTAARRTKNDLYKVKGQTVFINRCTCAFRGCCTGDEQH